jgi:thiol-disulfide isomerase/thioredoxin
MTLRQLTQFDFHHVLAETDGLSLIVFTSPGCGACRHLKHTLEKQADDFSAINLFEVDAQQEMALTREFEVFHLPALFLYRNGLYHAPIHAEPTPSSLLSAIEEALAADPREAP